MGFYFESSFIKIEVRNLNIIIGGYFELSSFIMPKVGNLDAMIRSYFTYFQNDRGQYFLYKIQWIQRILLMTIIRVYQIND